MHRGAGLPEPALFRGAEIGLDSGSHGSSRRGHDLDPRGLDRFGGVRDQVPRHQDGHLAFGQLP